MKFLPRNAFLFSSFLWVGAKPGSFGLPSPSPDSLGNLGGIRLMVVQQGAAASSSVLVLGGHPNLTRMGKRGRWRSRMGAGEFIRKAHDSIAQLEAAISRMQLVLSFLSLFHADTFGHPCLTKRNRKGKNLVLSLSLCNSICSLVLLHGNPTPLLLFFTRATKEVCFIN